MLLIRLGSRFRRVHVGVRLRLLEALRGNELAVLSSRHRNVIRWLLGEALTAIVEGVVLIRASQGGD